MQRFSSEELYRLRSEIPLRNVMERLLELPIKEVEGVFRFLCPLCNEFRTSLNPEYNLGRCFRCNKNFNPIDIVMAERDQNFVESVRMLIQEEPLLKKEPPLKPALSQRDYPKHIEMIHQLSDHLSNPYNVD